MENLLILFLRLFDTFALFHMGYRRIVGVGLVALSVCYGPAMV
jgi:hypothetical protein